MAKTTRQNAGNASSLAIAPEVPFTRDAPRVTKFPVTCAVKRPWRARNPAVSTYPPLKLNSAPRAGFCFSGVTIRICLRSRHSFHHVRPAGGLGLRHRSARLQGLRSDVD